jgi:hypothetical protein
MKMAEICQTHVSWGDDSLQFITIQNGHFGTTMKAIGTFLIDFL